MHKRTRLASVLWARRMQAYYTARTPEYARITRALRAAGAVEHSRQCTQMPIDHMALRTLRMPERGLGLQPLDAVVRRYGYEPRDRYRFDAKHVAAQWYAPPRGTALPRLFVSELCVDELSPRVQEIFSHYVRAQSAIAQWCAEYDAADVDVDLVHSVYACTDALHAPLYGSEAPQRAHYEQLREESEYGAWTLVHGHRVNHTAIAIDNLRTPLNAMRPFVDHLRSSLGVRMHGDDGDVLQRSSDGLLTQSSTQAQSDMFLFGGDTAPTAVPGAFVEFVERHREGFDVGNADKIFESTNQRS